MDAKNIEKLTTLLTTLESEVEELLVAQDVYEIGHYGWSDHETIDTDYLGLYLWQNEPPFELDMNAFLSGKAVTYEPTKRDEVLFTKGEDFVGIMSFARRSMGMALCHGAISNATNLLNEDREFWHQYAVTLQWLSIASDRLREFFLMAKFGQTMEQYEPKGKRATDYSDPFVRALEEAPNDLRQCLMDLMPISQELERHRTERNRLVHRLATREAKHNRDFLREQRIRFRKTMKTQDSTVEELTQSASVFFAIDEPSRAIDTMKTWYTRLVKASNLVFEFERFARNE